MSKQINLVIFVLVVYLLNQIECNEISNINGDKQIVLKETINVWQNVPVEKLIGYCATRIKPIRTNYGDNFSHSDDGVYIRNMSPHGHISFSPNVKLNCGIWIDTLDYRWNDDGWVRAPDDWCSEIDDYIVH